MTVKKVNINSKVLYINIVIIIIIKVDGALALIIATFVTNVAVLYCTKFHIIRFRTTSETIDKGIIIHRRDYILSGFNWY